MNRAYVPFKVSEFYMDLWTQDTPMNHSENSYMLDRLESSPNTAKGHTMVVFGSLPTWCIKCT